MIRLGSLLFPSLGRCGETTFKSGSQGATTLYRLDWSRADSAREASWVKWAGNGPSTSSCFYLCKYHGTLPKKYEDWVKDMLFAIPQSYYDEIHRTARMGLIEWSTERHFDTMIRDICLQPAIGYIFTSFRLLADCLYDEKTNYFSRDPDKVIAPQALLYKFWSGQTGRGLIRDHAHFNRIESSEQCTCVETDTASHIRCFLKAIKEHEDLIEKDCPHMSDGPAVGSDSTASFTLGTASSGGLNSFTVTTGQPALVVDGPVIINGELTVNPAKPKSLDMKTLFQEETGIVAETETPDGGRHLTPSYVKWLEDRASRSFKESKNEKEKPAKGSRC